jgi:hypothetical protein
MEPVEMSAQHSTAKIQKAKAIKAGRWLVVGGWWLASGFKSDLLRRHRIYNRPPTTNHLPYNFVASKCSLTSFACQIARAYVK